MQAKLYIGTPGYIYGHWDKGVFYPPGLKSAEKLADFFSNLRKAKSVKVST